MASAARSVRSVRRRAAGAARDPALPGDRRAVAGSAPRGWASKPAGLEARVGRSWGASSRTKNYASSSAHLARLAGLMRRSIHHGPDRRNGEAFGEIGGSQLLRAALAPQRPPSLWVASDEGRRVDASHF
jgi:hypothetical protein